MKLTITCQTCGKIISTIEKDQISDDDIQSYEQNSFCDTVQGEGQDDDGNPIILFDGNSNIQATKTQE